MEIKDNNYWSLSPKDAIKLQNDLKNNINIRKKINIENINNIAATDVSYRREKKEGKAVVVIWDFKSNKLISYETVVGEIKYPYIPGLLSFRECPLLIEVLKKIDVKIDVIIVDGQGIAHPRNFGEASHIGLITGIPTIGCAKTKLVGDYKKLDYEKDSLSFLIYKNKKIGVAFRSKKNVKPIFISPGNNIDIMTSLKIISRLISKYRIPDPLRMAHIISKNE
jgi:deoxyribonuclease V